MENKQQDDGEAESNDANSYEAGTPIVKLSDKIEPNENRVSKQISILNHTSKTTTSVGAVGAIGKTKSGSMPRGKELDGTPYLEGEEDVDLFDNPTR